MSDGAPARLNVLIAERIRRLRVARGMSLDDLARESGVSRSMISLIERAENNSTAVLLERLATSLGVTLASLFEPAERQARPVARAADQPVWRDPATGYRRRNVSPPGILTPIQIVEVEMPAGARVAYESGARGAVIHQQVWLLEGALEVQVGQDAVRLGPGDAFAFVLDRPISFHNPGAATARYAVVIASPFAAAPAPRPERLS